MKNRSKIYTMIALSLFALSILSFGTYAMFTTELLTGDSSISTGQVKMSYSESNEITLNNAVPTSDKKGTSSTDYFEFKVNTYIKTNKEMTMNYNIVIEPLDVDSSYYWFNDSDIKVYLTKVENNTETLVVGPINMDDVYLNEYVLKSQEETFNKGDTEHSTTYRLRAWLDYDYDASKINSHAYSYKFRVNINNDGVPKGLVPILGIQVGTNGIEKIVHEIDDTLQVDERFKTEYRYRGGEVNNYVTFNDEVWRIIGVIPTEDINGNVDYRVKIIRDESIGNMDWNTTFDKNTNSYNNWTTATLNTYLRNDYYNSLSSTAQYMLDPVKTYLGGYKDSRITTDVMWQYERKNEANRTGYYYGTNPISENEMVSLMYASDYGYAASKECLGSAVLQYYNLKEECITVNNWLDKSQFEYILPQQVATNNNSTVFAIFPTGKVDSTGLANSLAVRPVLFLDTKTFMSSGNGTKEEPYLANKIG